MGKNKKNKNPKPKKTDSAFQKKKVKVGKRIARSNDTQISIKTRKIVLPTQHVQKNDQQVFKGKCISEYITGTKHTNSNQRTQNVLNIQEMLSMNLGLISANAGCLIERLGVLLQDPEDTVRHGAIEVTKTIVNNMKSDDLFPFLHVFITQLSSGMLHINKDIQKTSIYALNSLLQRHFSAVMKFSSPFLSSLVTLLSTKSNKTSTLEYLQVLELILKFYKKSDAPDYRSRVKLQSVALYKYNLLHLKHDKPAEKNHLLEKLCAYALPHIENIWLEDAPSQVYAHVDGAVLKTCISLVELIQLIRNCSSLTHSTANLMKLNDITKSLAGRFPLVCSSVNKDQRLLWNLNLRIACYLVSVERYSKVTEYFLLCFKQRIQDLSTEEVSEALSLLSTIPNLNADTIRELQFFTFCASPSGTRSHSTTFLSHFVRSYWLNCADQDKILRCLEKDLNFVASDIIHSFYKDRQKLEPKIFHLCLDKKIFCGLSEENQIRCLELYFSESRDIDASSARTLSCLGQASRSSSVRNKFYSILLSLYHERRIGSADYISVLLSQANRDDEEGSTSLELVTSFCSDLLCNFTPLPLALKNNLFSLCAGRVTEQLYAGLSDFSLTAYLILLRAFHAMNRKCCEGENGGEVFVVTEDNDGGASDRKPVMELSEDVSLKLSKIICSLVFHSDSMDDWGSDVVKLAAKLSIEHPHIFDYVTCKMKLENKSVDILLWYLKVALTCERKSDRFRNGLHLLWKFLESRITESQKEEVSLRMKIRGI